jgi:hypothetical protein
VASADALSRVHNPTTRQQQERGASTPHQPSCAARQITLSAAL